MEDQQINKMIFTELDKINYFVLLDVLKYFHFNDKTKLDSIKKYFNLISQVKNPTFNNIYLIGERYENTLENLLSNINNYSPNEILAEILDGLGMIVESIEDLKLLLFDEEINENIVTDLINEFNKNYILTEKSAKSSNESKILILDDNYEILQMMDLILAKNNFKTLLTTNSNRILNILKNNNISLCIFDYNLPRKNGIDVLKTVKPLYPNLPIIFYSANKDPDVKKEALLNGAADYILKPASETIILSTIKENISLMIPKKPGETFKPEKIESKIANLGENDSFTNKTELPVNSNAISVLLVDREKIITKLIKSKFASANIKMEISTNIKDSFKRCVANEYNLIIIDTNFEEEDPFDLIKSLRLNPVTNNIKIIILSSISSDQIKEEAYRLGINDYITKPFSMNELFIKVNKLTTGTTNP